MDQHYLRERLPTSEVLLDLEPEELGAIIIEAMRRGDRPMATVANVPAAFYEVGQELPGYPRMGRAQVERALIEAWSWLESQGLIVWADFANGPNGYRTLSRRAEALHPEQFEDFVAARALPRELLHERIRDRVWSDFVRGHFDSAVLFATREVEIAVREAAGFGDDQHGVAMMRQAFNPDEPGGPLSDMNALPAERSARAALFAGVIGAYRNPVAHRDVNMEEPTEAIEVIVIASHLLRIVDLRMEAEDDGD